MGELGLSLGIIFFLTAVMAGILVIFKRFKNLRETLDPRRPNPVNESADNASSG